MLGCFCGMPLAGHAWLFLRYAAGLCGGLLGASGLSGWFWGGSRSAFRLRGSRRRRGAAGGSRLRCCLLERGRRRRSGHGGVGGTPADGRRLPVFCLAPAPAGLVAAECPGWFCPQSVPRGGPRLAGAGHGGDASGRGPAAGKLAVASAGQRANAGGGGFGGRRSGRGACLHGMPPLVLRLFQIRYITGIINISTLVRIFNNFIP